MGRAGVRYMRDESLQTQADADDNSQYGDEDNGQTICIVGPEPGTKKVYCVWVDSDDRDPMYSVNDDEGGWAAEADVASGHTAEIGISANIIERNSFYRLAVIFHDTTTSAGDLFYAEVQLGAVPSADVIYSDMSDIEMGRVVQTAAGMGGVLET